MGAFQAAVVLGFRWLPGEATSECFVEGWLADGRGAEIKLTT